MTEQRKLAAVMFTDIVGYTALMSKDEQKVLTLLQKNRELQKTLAQKHNGEFLKEMGDGTLLCFQSALDAVRCAMKIQQSVQDDPDLNLRIGIHLGDIVFKDGDVFGDGVNVASRIEALAEAGGICISEQIFLLVKNQPEIEAEFLGERTLKNVDDQIKVYAIKSESKNSSQPESTIPKERDSKEESIVVLPFENMSSDPEQEYFSDGLTEEIITDLSQIRSLRVISRTSSMVLKGSKKNIKQIGRELDVKYVLEGSVRKAGNNVRITAQLIDAVHDMHLWAEKYNGTLDNVFDLQEKVSQEIQTALKISVGNDEQKRLEKRYTDNFKAYDLYLKGLHLRRNLREGSIHESIEYFKRAIEIDPDYALAYAGIAYAYFLLPFYTSVKSSEVYAAGKNAFEKALALDDQLPEAYEALSLITAYFDWDWDGAKQAAEKMVELNPSYPWGYFHLSAALGTQGKLEESIHLMNKALRLDPLNWAFNRNLGFVYLAAGQPETAIEIAHRTLKLDSQAPAAYILLSKAYLAKGNYREALAATDKENNYPQGLIEPLRGIIYTHLERKEEASRVLEKYCKLQENEFTPFYSIAALCVALGKTEQALDFLERGYENHDVQMHRIKIDFLFDGIRSEPRFKELLRKMGLDF
ncbi:tetratricopeptide repeat protein [bacterium]|nr:tetratricopeptide repeat protein [bacterium]